MAAARHHFKVGLFVVLLTIGCAAFLIWIGSTGVGTKDTVPVAVFFNESVQGLSEGSEVKYRGFKIGEVTTIDVASDRKHLEVKCLLRRDFAEKIGVLAGKPDPKNPGIAMADAVVASLVSSGLTGLKFVDIDLPARMPESALGVPDGVTVPDGVSIVLPSTPSTLKSVEIAVNDALDAVKMHGPNVGGIIDGLYQFLDSLNKTGVTQQATDTIKHLDERIGQLDTKGLSDSANGLFTEVGKAVAGANTTISDLAAENGDIRRTVRQIESSARTLSDEVKSADLPNTTIAVRDSADRVGKAADAVAGAATQLTSILGELDLTLRSVRATVDELRGLVIVVEQDPSALLFGRDYRTGPPKK